MRQFRAFIAGERLVEGQEVVVMPGYLAVGATTVKRLPKLETWVVEHWADQGNPVLVSREYLEPVPVAEPEREATREERMRPNPNKVDRPFDEIGRPYTANHTEPLGTKTAAEVPGDEAAFPLKPAPGAKAKFGLEAFPRTNAVFPKSNWELSFREWPNFAAHCCNLEIVAVNPRLGVTTELILTDQGLHISNAKPA